MVHVCMSFQIRTKWALQIQQTRIRCSPELFFNPPAEWCFVCLRVTSNCSHLSVNPWNRNLSTKKNMQFQMTFQWKKAILWDWMSALLKRLLETLIEEISRRATWMFIAWSRRPSAEERTTASCSGYLWPPWLDIRFIALWEEIVLTTADRQFQI